MDVGEPRGGGMDGPQQAVTVCLVLATSGGRPRTEGRPLRPMTAAVLALADGLTAEAVTPVAMERTGVDGQPIWQGLAGRGERRLVHAPQVTPGPGRTTDVKDGAWLADRWRHG